MYKFLHKYIAQLTMFGVALGLFFGMAWGSKPELTGLGEDGFIREAELGAHMRILVTASDMGSALKKQVNLASRTIDVSENVKVYVPDQYATSTYGCSSFANQDIWFDGEYGARTEIFDQVLQVGTAASKVSDHHLVAVLQARGSVYKCDSERRRNLLASGIALVTPLHPDPSISDNPSFYKL